MSLNKYLQANVLLSNAVKSDETAVRKNAYLSRVNSNWRSALPPLALFDRYYSITTLVLHTNQAQQYLACNYYTYCCYTATPQTPHIAMHTTHTVNASAFCVYARVSVCAVIFTRLMLNVHVLIFEHVGIFYHVPCITWYTGICKGCYSNKRMKPALHCTDAITRYTNAVTEEETHRTELRYFVHSKLISS